MPGKRRTVNPEREKTLRANANKQAAMARTNTQVSRTEQERERTRQHELRVQQSELVNQREKQRIEARRTRTSADSSRRVPSFNVPSGPSKEASLSLLKDPKQSHHTIVTCWVLGMAIISWQEIKANKDAPIPKAYVGWSALMGILDLAAPIISFQLAGVFAVGLVIGMILTRKPMAHYIDPSNGVMGDVADGPYKPGQKTNLSGGQGSGQWLTTNNGNFWESFLPWSQSLAANHPYPSNDPTHKLYVFSEYDNKWLLKSKLTGSKYDPSMSPSSTMQGAS